MLDTSRHASTLAHYFQTLYEAAGLHWSHDNHVEIEELVNGIADDAVRESERLRKRAEPDA